MQRHCLSRFVCLVLSIIAPLALTARARADALNDVRARGALIWGGDQEGGGPYVYPAPDDPDRVTGFEVDLADAVAAELGVRAKFFQGDWGTLPEFLRNRQIDVVLNGYEWSPARAARMRASRPYYIYELQLLAAEGDAAINGWVDLQRQPHGRRPQVASLSGSAASDYLRRRLADAIELVEYNGSTDAMMQVRSGVHEATLQDLPIAVFYRSQPQGRGLKFVDRPVGRGYYVMFARPEDARLIAAIDAAIETLFRNGQLKAIYSKYGLWNDRQNGLLDAKPGQSPSDESGAQADPSSAAAAATAGALVDRDDSSGGTIAIAPGDDNQAPVVDAPPRGFEVVRRYTPILLRAAWVTIFLSIASMPIAILLGLTVAVGRLYGPAWLRPPLAVYVEVLRGTPAMLQLYVIYFLLPTVLPFRFDPIVAAIIGLAINYSAYESEIYRAGLQAIPRGQMEAALALGLTRWSALRRIIIPQAVRLVVPPVTNDFIALFKDTSICSVIAVTELTKQYNVLANSTGAIVELAAMTGVMYLLMSYPLSRVARRMEARMDQVGHAVRAA